MFHFSDDDFVALTKTELVALLEPAPCIFSLDALIAWLEKKPADEEYNYTDGKSCLVYQYLTDAGMSISHVTAGRYFTTPYTIGANYPGTFNQIAYGNWETGPNGRTFGAALQRAREYANR